MDVTDVAFVKRLQTFGSWRLTFINPVQLATAGFHYTGHGDNVECGFCDVEIHSWEKGDVPLREHLFWRPQCGFARSLIQPTDELEKSWLRELVPVLPKHQELATYKARFHTFSAWPGRKKYDPNTIAAAGFFIDGREVECFHCGCKANWITFADDSAWHVHGELNPKCSYLLASNVREALESLEGPLLSLDSAETDSVISCGYDTVDGSE